MVIDITCAVIGPLLLDLGAGALACVLRIRQLPLTREVYYVN